MFRELSLLREDTFWRTRKQVVVLDVELTSTAVKSGVLTVALSARSSTPASCWSASTAARSSMLCRAAHSLRQRSVWDTCGHRTQPGHGGVGQRVSH